MFHVLINTNDQRFMPINQLTFDNLGFVGFQKHKKPVKNHLFSGSGSVFMPSTRV